jgi:hypothetical protein
MTSAAAGSSHRGAALVGFVVFAILFAAARSIDVPRTAYGLKSDEATYVMMALSVAHDGNLSYERRDFERFAGIYQQGPEGIFLKKGRRLRVGFRAPFPYVHLIRRSDPDTTRLYFGKPFVYSVFAAPFVWWWGLNGMLVFHALLLAAVGACGYLFLAAHSPPPAALVFTTAFVGAAAVPIYGVFLMPEIFNLALVFFAYFLWLYKEVSQGLRLNARWTDIAAAVLLGIATYSKPVPNAFLVAPLVLFAWWRRRWMWGFATGGAAVAAASVLFAATAAISGEFNYQGGEDRRTFYSDRQPPDFPFDAPGSTWDRFPTAEAATDGTAAVNVLTSPNAPGWFAHNVPYFLFGRHFGFAPYYFPGVVAILLWLWSPARRDAWRILIVGAFAAAAISLLVILPFTWSGGGGPPGNRYLVSAYPVLFFVVPPLGSALPGVIAWTVGALFTARMLVNPFASAKFTWEIFETGPARLLPVELTMGPDLPVMLAQPPRGRIQYSHDPFMLLYFLDRNAWPPEPDGMWVSGAGTAEIVIRVVDPLRHVMVEAASPIATTLTVSLGGEEARRELQPDQAVAFNVAAPAGVRERFGYAYLMRARSSQGFVPRVRNPESNDYRNLGAQMRFRAVSIPKGSVD